MRSNVIASLALSVWLSACGASSPSTAGTGAAGAASANGGGGASGSGAATAGASGLNADGGANAAAGTTSSGGASNAGTASGGSANGGSSGNASAAMGGASTAGSAGAGGVGTPIIAPAGYTLVWHDEFDVDGAPDPKNWKFEQGFVRNEEAQWYQASNARVQGGLLVIEARKETVQNPNYSGAGDWRTTRKTAEYTSASLNTSGLQSFEYGHFEMRARIPTAAGMWPAWWTLGVSGEWPSNGEIDIMEFYQGKVLANVACGTATRYQAKWDSATKPLSALGADFTAQFHIWTMDWDDQNIALGLDGASMNTTALSAALNANGMSPFKQKDYILLNLALGGQNGGDPAQTIFPQRYEIDYVRVFQKQ